MNVMHLIKLTETTYYREIYEINCKTLESYIAHIINLIDQEIDTFMNTEEVKHIINYRIDSQRVSDQENVNDIVSLIPKDVHKAIINILNQGVQLNNNLSLIINK